MLQSTSGNVARSGAELVIQAARAAARSGISIIPSPTGRPDQWIPPSLAVPVPTAATQPRAHGPRHRVEIRRLAGLSAAQPREDLGAEAGDVLHGGGGVSCPFGHQQHVPDSRAGDGVGEPLHAQVRITDGVHGHELA